MQQMSNFKMPEAFEFLTLVDSSAGSSDASRDTPLLVTRTQHEQILMYIAFGAREKADEAIERGRKAYEVYMAHPELPIPVEGTPREEREREEFITRLEKLLALLRS